MQYISIFNPEFYSKPGIRGENMADINRKYQRGNNQLTILPPGIRQILLRDLK